MISTAWAQDAIAQSNGAASAIMSAVPFILVFAVFYFFVMRPQMQAAKKHADLVSALKKGDVVVTDGGLIGEVAALKDAFVHVKLGEGMVVTVAREAVRSTLSAEAAKGWEAKAATEAKKR